MSEQQDVMESPKGSKSTPKARRDIASLPDYAWATNDDWAVLLDINPRTVLRNIKTGLIPPPDAIFLGRARWRVRTLREFQKQPA